ncbi:WD40 repeat domain-containing protein [Vairimorpha necatrix]|uniref:WD40 repeat domain-containing protein n=1 Tax=Vairimorpha necatrix TaxID=6039 RepID=A0AAX4JFR9_9MICR
MLQPVKFSNKLLSLDYDKDSIFIGDTKGYIYKYKLTCSKIEKLFYCDSPISSVVKYNTDIYYTNWDGYIFKNDKSTFLQQDIIKSMIIRRDLIYVAVDFYIYILSLDLEIKEKIKVPIKVLSFCNMNEYIVCGLTLPFLGFLDKKNNLTIKKTNHDTGILCVKFLQNKIYTGCVDGSIQVYDISEFIDDNKEIDINQCQIINEKSKKWIRDIFSENLFSRGNEIVYNAKKVYEHDDEVTRVIKIDDKIFSIGIDCTMKTFTEEKILDAEMDEIQELNK